jgi:MFS family permease
VITAEEIRQPRGAFGALASRNYRIYLTGQLLANTGTWMQSIAQDWLVLTLTRSSAAVGVTMALQFLPMLIFGMHAGLIADRFPKRRILLITQSLNATATLTLALITISGAVRATDIYGFALLAGLIFAFDGPARQSFAAEVVPASRLGAAIALNGAVFQATRLIGPAIASLLIARVGPGWVFAVNAACYLGPTIGLLRLRQSELAPPPAAVHEARAVRTAARYVRRRPDLLRTLFLVGIVGTFGLNFPIVLTAMAKWAFHGNAGTYGLFNISLAVGSVAGALLAGTAARPPRYLIVISAAAFGLLQLGAAAAPDMAAFLALLVGMGFANLAFQAMANASVQLSVDPRLRGRIMGLYMLVFIGGTPFGAPVIGVLTNHLGARAGMAICGALPALAAAAVAAAAIRRHRASAGPGLDRQVSPPRSGGRENLGEVEEVSQGQVGADSAQRCDRGSGRTPGGDAGDGILDHEAPGDVHAQRSCR